MKLAIILLSVLLVGCAEETKTKPLLSEWSEYKSQRTFDLTAAEIGISSAITYIGKDGSQCSADITIERHDRVNVGPRNGPGIVGPLHYVALLEYTTQPSSDCRLDKDGELEVIVYISHMADYIDVCVEGDRSLYSCRYFE